MKNTAIPLLIVPLLLIAGCSSSFLKVRDAVNSAPAWYGERRAEIRGEGYPDLSALPEVDPANVPGAALKGRADMGEALTAAFADPRASVAVGGAEEIRAIADSMIGGFGDIPPESDFLTEAEIAAIRSQFNVPRVTQDDY
ncbi:hypothetical protein IQ219_00620 [Synechocystis sp. LEGE 06083]|uniref:hypothetical protein n=1 Tax=Synechocystis sp. LEGE 06083 TaxID=915336 RepID=UPI001880220B|nr:hypothetical protein [Synechocystis sp. LEGE 06083]MBE9193860.1 hypothetical protein [Synechocystis sp. LEGE 06083]